MWFASKECCLCCVEQYSKMCVIECQIRIRIRFVIPFMKLRHFRNGF